MTTRAAPSTRFRPQRGMSGKNHMAAPDRRVGSTKKSPTEKAMPSTTAKVVKKRMAFSLPSFSSSHFSNREGSSGSSSSG